MVDPEAEPGMGPIVGSRSIEAVHPDGRAVSLTIQLGSPRTDPAMDDAWACPCRILGLGDAPVWRLYGVDSLQAVAQAVELLRRVLRAEAEEHGWTFTWGGEPGLAMADVLW